MRQAWITLLLLLAGCAGLPGDGAAPMASAAPRPATVAVAPGVTLLPGRFLPDSQPDGNTVLLRGADGVVVVDSGRHRDHAQRVLDAVRGQGGVLAAIVNTHWHLDHVGGNALLRQAYPRAPVLASDAIEPALAGFLADYRLQLDDLVRAPASQVPPARLDEWRAEIARIDAADALRPTRQLDGPLTLELGGRALQLGVERGAVSGGDVWVLDRATGTLLAGDLVTLPAPLLDTACPAGWRAALARLDALDFQALVPGHGAPMDRAGFEAWRRGFDRLLDCAASDAPTATCQAQWQADTASLVPAPGATPDALRAYQDGLLTYYIEQVLRAPPTRRDRYCAAGAAT